MGLRPLVGFAIPGSLDEERVRSRNLYGLRFIAIVLTVTLLACLSACGSAVRESPTGATTRQVNIAEMPPPYAMAAWIPLSYTDAGSDDELIRKMHDVIDRVATSLVSSLEKSLGDVEFQRQYFTGGAELYWVETSLGERTQDPGKIVVVIPYDQHALAHMLHTHGAERKIPGGSIHIFRTFIAATVGSIDRDDIVRIMPYRISPTQPSMYLQAALRLSPALLLEESDEVLEALSELGGDMVDLKELAGFLPEIRRTEAAIQVIRDIQTLDANVVLKPDGLEVSLRVTPVAGSRVAKFFRHHEQRGVESLPHVPGHADMMGFWSVDPETLTLLDEIDVQEQTTTLPWSTSERHFIEQTNKTLRRLRGDTTTFALYRGATDHSAAAIFVESKEPDKFMGAWVDLLKITLARRRSVSDAGRRGHWTWSFDDQPSMLEPDHINSFAAAAIDSYTFRTQTYRFRLQQRDAWHIGLEYRDDQSDEKKIVGLSSSTNEHGVLVVAGENSRMELERWITSAADGGTSRDASGRLFGAARNPMFGLTILEGGLQQHLPELLRMAPFLELTALGDWLDEDDTSETDGDISETDDDISETDGDGRRVAVLAGWVDTSQLHVRLTFD